MTDTEHVRQTLLVAQAVARTHRLFEHAEDCAQSVEEIGALAKWKREQEDETKDARAETP